MSGCKTFTATSCSCVHNAQEWGEILGFSVKVGETASSSEGICVFPAIQQKMINILAGEQMNNTHIV